MTGSNAIVPRIFRLLDEFNKGERGEGVKFGISYGLLDQNDGTFTDWITTVLDQFDNNFEVHITCDKNYPNKSPVIKMGQQLMFQFFNSDGSLQRGMFPLIDNWNSSTTIADILNAIQFLINQNYHEFHNNF
jgi:ubiquitin-protein ligase